jgi:signal transduction histidine kinase
MPKLNVFWKIYLSFLFITTLVAVTQVNLDRLLGFGPFSHNLRDRLGLVLSGSGPTIVEYQVRNDQTGAISFITHLKNSTGITLYSVDQKGKDVAGRSLPQGVAAAALRVQQSGKPEYLSHDREVLLAQPLKAADGKSYYVIGITPKQPGHPAPLPPPAPRPFGEFPGPPPPPGHGLFLIISRFLIVLIISGGVCYWLARYLTSPVVTLREATRRFAGGELSVRIGKGIGNRKDEFTDLADDFDTMAERIGALMVQQRQLLRDISHELRSPLTRLNLAVELARRQVGSEIAPTLDRIETESSLLNDMIGQVLTLARLESNVGEIRRVPVDLAKLVTEIVSDADFEAQARNCTVQITESTPCMLSGNEDLLHRAIENVVRNAVTYTHENTTVDITVGHIIQGGTGHAEIIVRDHGPGVPAIDLPHLFRPFYRVSNARDRQTGGTGLGLAITERAVKLHNGSVTASNAPGGGLVVIITLPAPADPLPLSSRHDHE